MSQIQPNITPKGARLKAIRKALGLTQVDFAKKLGTKQNIIPALEKDKRPLGARLTKDILTTFAVNKEWWENGRGEMFHPEGFLTLTVMIDPTQISVEEIQRMKGIKQVQIVE